MFQAIIPRHGCFLLLPGRPSWRLFGRASGAKPSPRLATSPRPPGDFFANRRGNRGVFCWLQHCPAQQRACFGVSKHTLNFWREPCDDHFKGDQHKSCSILGWCLSFVPESLINAVSLPTKGRSRPLSRGSLSNFAMLTPYWWTPGFFWGVLFPG